MDISPWLEFGWPIGLLVLVLTSIGVGLGWFLKAYLRQQKAEFEARQEERKSKDGLILEQHEFVKGLATSALAESSEAIKRQGETNNFLKEITRSLTIMNEQLHDHAVECENGLVGIKTQNQQIYDHVIQLERTALTSHGRKGAD
jgi:hypothetical protein